MFLIGAAALAGSVYLMNGWEGLSGAGKAGAIALAVLGTLLLLPALLIWGIGLFTRFFLARLSKQMSSVGEQIVGMNKELYEKLHEYRPATSSDFESHDRGAYDGAERTLAGLGFRQLGDVVNATIEDLRGVVCVMRVMASTDGSTVAGVYDMTVAMRQANWDDDDDDDDDGDEAGDRDREPHELICEMSTEFTDGTFVATANTKEFDLTTAATGIDRRQYPRGTSIADLVPRMRPRK